MNNHMYEHAATQANLDALRARGVTVLEPGVGALGSKHEWGVGPAAPSPPSCSPPSRRVVPRRAAAAAGTGCGSLVTAGGTREPIDAVRYVGNRSLGPDGLRAGRGGRRAAAPTSPSSPPTSRCRATRASRYVDVETAAELHAACEREFARLRRPADGRRRRRLPPGAAPRDGKLKKDGRDELDAGARARRPTSSAASPPRAAPGQMLVGFAAEHGEGAIELRPRQARAQGPRRRRRQRHLARRHRLRRRPTTR